MLTIRYGKLEDGHIRFGAAGDRARLGPVLSAEAQAAE
jgi:hypothetical protein